MLYSLALLAEQATTWPDAFAIVGMIFGMGFCLWVIFKHL